MKKFQIKSHANQAVLFEGTFESFRRCLEAAVSDRARLDTADLRNANLANAILDDAHMPGAVFTNANLSGANLSEALLHGCTFKGATLYNTCLACSDLQKCNFEDAGFGATDIAGCDISFSSFSTLSCFSLDFTTTRRMAGCIFKASTGNDCEFSHPPVVIRGLGNNPVVLMDRQIHNGHEPMHYKDFLGLLKSRIEKTERAFKAISNNTHG